MITEIYRLSLGVCNCYLIKEESLILVDGGAPNKREKFLEELRKLSIEPKDISLILLTHGHWDHIGSVSDLKRLTDCKVAVNQHEKDFVEQGEILWTPRIGIWGKILEAMLKISVFKMKIPGTFIDLVLEDEEFSLESYGIHGRVLHTPGHTIGSMSLLLDTGEAFVGDLAMNGIPLRIGPGLPTFAEDVGVVEESWQLLLNNGAKWIYPAHGKPFEADVLERLL